MARPSAVRRLVMLASRVTLVVTSLAVLVVVLLLAPAKPALAATITVTSAGDPNPIVSGDGCTLREAIQAANTNLPVNECLAGDNLPIVDRIEFAITPLDGMLKTIIVAPSGLPSITQ